MVRAPHFHCFHGQGSIPGRVTKIKSRGVEKKKKDINVLMVYIILQLIFFTQCCMFDCLGSNSSSAM